MSQSIIILKYQALICLATLLLSYLIRASDTSSTYLAVNADAMDYHQSSTTLAFSTPTFDIKFVNANTKATTNTISTSHLKTITTLKMSSDASLIFSGGTDFRFYIHDTSSGSAVCWGDELRGQILSATIFDDFDRFAFVTNEGFIYYGNITDCQLSFASILDHKFSSIISINANDEIWVIDETSDILYILSVPTFSASSLTFGTHILKSIFKIPSTSTLGICTQFGFYVIDYSGTVLFSYGQLSVLTYKCTITQLSTNEYALTVISEQQTIRYQQTDTYYLWNIWKLVTSPSYSLAFIHEQSNSGSRYSNTQQPLNAYTISISTNTIYVASIASSSNPLQNFFGYSGSCSGGLYNSGGGTCSLCVLTVPSCSQCSSAPICSSCYPFKYLDSSKVCLSCPSNCYKCTSSTTCKSCIAGYEWKSNACVLSNITGCGTGEWDDNRDVSRCVECEIGYYLAQGDSCHLCSIKFLNCSECDTTKCTHCQPNFYMPDTSTGFCESCSLYNEGCASCLNSTYCQACFDDYPYYDTVSSTERYCKQACYYLCVSCNKIQYDECTACDANRTLTGTTCVCNQTEYIVDPDSLACIACRDYISDCQNCSSTTFCDTCDANFYFNNVSATEQSCKTCNYTCLTCDTYWWKCATCDTGNNFRILDTDTFQCLCPIVTRFEYNGNLLCELCRDHLSDCDTCYNQTYCLKCDQGFYIHTISTGNNECRACANPCKECFGSSSNCTQCYSGRELNNSAGTCECLYGYYPNGTLSCNACSNVLGGCQNCDNDTICLLCWPNNYFYMDGSKKKCDICKETCLTCNTWTTVCNDCDPTANRDLNVVTNQCDCMTGFIQTDGICLDCSGTFEHCNSCDLSRCYSCDDGYSLAYEGLKCIQCSKTYPGCTKCLNGVCAQCDKSAGYELSITKCICSPGYYFKQLECLPYKMGSLAQRRFPVFQKYEQIMSNDSIKISFYFQCEGIYMPYDMQESVSIKINGMTIQDYSYYFDNTTLFFFIEPSQEYSQADISVQFKNKTVFDLDEYGPKRRVFNFNKNVFLNSTYELSENFAETYSSQIIQYLRWIFTICLILGSTDVLVSLIFIIHFLPAFLLLDLGLPLPLSNVLNEMVKINQQSLFILSDLDLQFETYEETSLYKDNFGIKASIIDTKVMDLVIVGCFAAFYGILLPLLYQKVSSKLPQSKLKQLLQHKIILKRYSTLSNIFLCFIPSFLLSTVINFELQQYDSTLIFSVGVSTILCSFAAIFIFVHTMILLNTQFNDSYKNQDCYMGSSPLQSRSLLYIFPMLFLIGWGIPLLYGGSGIYVIPFMICVMLFHIWCFRNWNNFPSKVAYFIKLFIALFLLLYISAFLVFEISEHYDSVSIDAVEVIGLATLVHSIILFSLSLFDALFLVLLSLYRIFRLTCSNLNVVDNLDAEDNEFEEQKTDSSGYQVNLPEEKMKIESAKARQKLTDKRQHMKNFKQRHFLNTGHNNLNIFGPKSQKNFQMSSYQL